MILFFSIIYIYFLYIMSFYKYLFFYFIFIKISNEFEYLKNKNIRKEKHDFNNVRISNFTSQNEISYLFEHSKKNLIIAFHSDFCFDCYEMLQNLKQASTYNFVQDSTNIIFVNCDRTRNLCKDYNISRIPSIKVFLMQNNIFKPTKYIPISYELEYLLEYIFKISDLIIKNETLINIKNMRDLNKFSKNNGDVSFLLILDENENKETENLLKCYEKLSRNVNYISRYYFGYIYSENFQNFYYMKIPSIVLTGINYKDFNINKKIDNCNDIEDFVIENQYPLFSKFTINYLKKMNDEKKTICVFALKKNKYSSVQTIMAFIQNIALNRRDIVFGYINIDTDYHLIEYIHIKKNIDESIIFYDFKKGKYYIDNYKDSTRVEYLIDLMDKNKINWKSGYFIEEFLYKFGINIDRSNLLNGFFFILLIIIIFIFLFICLFIEKIDKKLK